MINPKMSEEPMQITTVERPLGHPYSRNSSNRPLYQALFRTLETGKAIEVRDMNVNNLRSTVTAFARRHRVKMRYRTGEGGVLIVWFVSAEEPRP